MNEGDRRFEELYKQTRRLVGALRRFGRQDADAQDIVQDTMLSVWQRLDSIRPAAERAYLWKATHNRARNQATRGPERFTDPLESLDHDHAPSPEARLLLDEKLAEARAIFAAAMAELSPETQQCLILAARGHRTARIAEMLGLHPTAVRSRISRATRLILAHLGKGSTP